MSTSIDYKSKLNDMFLDLLSDLIRMSPDDGDFRLYYATCKTAITLDNAMLYTIFHNKIAKYEARIMERDEDFLMHLDIENEIESSTEDVKHYVACVVKKLVRTWSHMSVADKDAIWRYWRTMLLLYKKIQGVST